MYENIESGLGKLIATGLVDTASFDTTGRFYIVGAASLANLQEIQGMYTPGAYHDGTPLFYTTLAAAVAKCRANYGDVIFVIPGHTENVSSATYLNLNVASVSVIGLGAGANRPYFTITGGTTSTVTVSAANCSIANCIFDGTGVASVVTIFTVSAANFTLKGCSVVGTNSTNQAALALTTTAGAGGMQLLSNYFQNDTTTGMTNALQLIGGNDIVISGNTFIGAYTTSLGAINNITTAGLRWVIQNNLIINSTASSTKAIVLLSGTSAFITNNRMAILSGTAPITAAGGYVGGNYYVAAAGVTAGTLL